MIHLLILILQNQNDDPMKLINKKNQCSSIIVVWSKESDTRKYYIDVKKSLISVSSFAQICVFIIESVKNSDFRSLNHTTSFK